MQDKSKSSAGLVIVAVVVLLLFIGGAVGIGGLFLWKLQRSQMAAAQNAAEQAMYAEQLARQQAELERRRADDAAAAAKDRETFLNSAPDVPKLPDLQIDAEE